MMSFAVSIIISTPDLMMISEMTAPTHGSRETPVNL